MLSSRLQTETGWLEALREKLNIDQYLSRFNLSTDYLIDISAYLVIGFLTGFLWKRYGRYLVFSVILLSLLLFGFEYLQLISINYIKLQSFIGITDTAGMDSLFQAGLIWIKDNLALVVSTIVGFVLGIKLG